MEAGEDQNTGSGSTNGNAQTSGNSRPPQIAHMSLYERQAVQALQALQRQPNAAQYFQQLMLQQQINSAQLLQQATFAASRQSNSPSNSVSQATTTVNLSTTSAGGTVTNPRPLGPTTSATSSALSQSVLLGGNSAGQGQMYLRVNRTLRAPLASQLIFMPGGTATAAVATVAQQQPQQQPQPQQEVPPTSSAQSDNDQVQNLALHCVSTPRLAAVKSEFPDRKEAVSYAHAQQQTQQLHQFSATPVPSNQFSAQQQIQQQQQQQQQQMANKMTGYAHPAAAGLPGVNVKGGNPSSLAPASLPPCSSPSSTLPLSQLLLSPSGLCQARAVTTVTPAATVTHILVPTCSVPASTQGYPVGSVAPKTVTAQTLVVQPLQQASADRGPVPIQPKTAPGHHHRVPVQLPPRHPPPILPAPPNNQVGVAGLHPAPHIPVQLVGARQGPAGNAQVVALAQARSSCAQDAVANASSHTVTVAKPAIGSLKRKSESDASGEMAAEPPQPDGPSARDTAPPLSPAPTQDPAPETVLGLSGPPTLSLSLPLSRGERAPLPQAVVKPQVLTHLIEGFVIQEGAEPFPAGLVKERPDGPFALTGPQTRENGGPPVLTCEYCQRLAPASQFRGSKRFCSKTCAKRYNVSCSHHYRTSRGLASAGPPPPPAPSAPDQPIVRRRGPRRSSSEIACAKIAGRHLPVKECRSESSRSEDASSCDGEEEEEEEEEDSPSLSPSSSLSCPRPAHCGPQAESLAPGELPLDVANFLPGSPAHWNVEDVSRFISSLQGCEELAAQFLSQEIDGQALLLLREEHLISTMNIKLGPALKICASINSLRD